MTLYYECSDGTIINFISDTISPEDPETLLRNSWEYSTISGVGGAARIKRFYKDAQESELTLEILADDAEQYNEIMRQMTRCFEYDIRTMQPGKLWWNGFYKEVFITEVEYEGFEELLESVTKKLVVLSTYPYWTKENVFSFLASDDTAGTLDYPYDYGSAAGTGFDYDQSAATDTITNDAVHESNFEIVFYGPVENPQIAISGHYHTLYTTLSTGEYARINSRTKKITKTGANGTRENIFRTRDRDSYVFQKVPPGLIAVNRARTMGVDVIIYDERGEPEWI